MRPSACRPTLRKPAGSRLFEAKRAQESERGRTAAFCRWAFFDTHVLLSTLVGSDERSEKAEALVGAAALDGDDRQDGQVIDDHVAAKSSEPVPVDMKWPCGGSRKVTCSEDVARR
jgi:hypothetical protein